MKKQEHIQEELKELSPLLAKLKQEVGEKADADLPPRYFAQMTGEVMEQVRGERNSPGWWQQLERALANWMARPRYVVSVATAAVALLFAAYFFGAQQQATVSTGTLANVDEMPGDEAVAEYLAYEMELSELVAAVEQNEKVEAVLPATTGDDINEALLQEYIYLHVEEQVILEETL